MAAAAPAVNNSSLSPEMKARIFFTQYPCLRFALKWISRTAIVIQAWKEAQRDSTILTSIFSPITASLLKWPFLFIGTMGMLLVTHLLFGDARPSQWLWWDSEGEHGGGWTRQEISTEDLKKAIEILGGKEKFVATLRKEILAGPDWTERWGVISPESAKKERWNLYFQFIRVLKEKLGADFDDYPKIADDELRNKMFLQLRASLNEPAEIGERARSGIFRLVSHAEAVDELRRVEVIPSDAIADTLKQMIKSQRILCLVGRCKSTGAHSFPHIYDELQELASLTAIGIEWNSMRNLFEQCYEEERAKLVTKLTTELQQLNETLITQFNAAAAQINAAQS